jgi:hypothetical protein
MKTLLATPIQTVTGDKLFALMSMDSGKVTVYDAITDYPLDTFSQVEWFQIIEDGLARRERAPYKVKYLTINW